MRANEFGTSPKRPQREGSRPSRGHDPQPRYTNEQQSVDETARMSAAVKLQRAFDRERAKSSASRKRGEEVMAQARTDWEKKQAAEKNKEQGVAEGLSKRDQQDVAAIKATIERLQAQLSHPNADRDAIQQSIAHERKRLALYGQGVAEEWSKKYKSSINCSHPKGFSQKAHCAGKKKHTESMMTMEATCPDCGMCQTHGDLNEIAKGAKDSNGYTSCWPGKHAEGTKKGKHGGQVRNCVPNESIAEAMMALEAEFITLAEEGKASRALCASSRSNKELGASNLASCKSQGLRPREGNKSHLMGKGPESRMKMGGHKVKGKKYGGKIPDWS